MCSIFTYKSISILTGHQYHKPRLKELCRYSEDISNCWTDLALELDLPSKTIDTLDIDYARARDKCRHMFSTWLERSIDPCWCEVIEALKMIKLSHLATDIEAIYLGKCSLCIFVVLRHVSTCNK